MNYFLENILKYFVLYLSISNGPQKGLENQNLMTADLPGVGVIQSCDPHNPTIEFIDVPLYTPSGDLLVRSINFSIKLGQNVIITGPNGSGKSSLFRLLGDLWPLYGGKLIKPDNNRLFYIPQKPYMALGLT